MTIINSDPCQFVDEFMVSIYNITHNMMWASIFIFIENPIIQIEVQDSYLLWCIKKSYFHFPKEI